MRASPRTQPDLQPNRCRRRERSPRALAALALWLALLASGPTTAGAIILPAQTIDGPNEQIVGFGGVAMAEDGTGGVVYLKRVEGVAHVFVSRYLQGRWLAPIRVDTEQPYGASWPRIGAADGGELVVVWATPFATEGSRPVDELLGSTLGPGSSAFGPAMIVDPNLRTGTGTSPDLAMSSTGQADVVYRVVNESSGQSIPLLRPGDVVEDVRVAHFNGETWTRLGAVNRNAGVSMRAPTDANAPQVAIGPTGNGVVVWQEPDIEGVARIWARRLFGRSLEYVLPVSARSFAGAPIDQDADAPAVAFSPLGQVEVAYRQPVGPGSPLPGPRIFLNTLTDGESGNGAEFEGATIVDTAVSGGTGASIGPPSIDIDEKRGMRLLYDSDGTPRVIEGTDLGLAGTLSLGPSFAGAQAPASVIDPAGGGVSAWPSADAHGNPALAVREDFPGGAVQTALLAGAAGGPIGEVAVGRSGLGDGIVAFMQGEIGDAGIVAAEATAPPPQVVVTAPNGWIRPAGATVSWQAAASAAGPLRYTVALDGRLLATPSETLQLRLPIRRLADGRHTVQVLVGDADGQVSLSARQTLHVDRTAPIVQFAPVQHGQAVRVRVSDRESWVVRNSVRIVFGDGSSARGRARATHRYARPGVYRVVVFARDRVGNAGAVSRLVSVG
ncbi:MAG TPA: PKD domain-containing protein [Solirubrobacteraceae bacterium]|jgi:hypothetical protein|nr:PKD domain-containing protein [Solirubrobacteraceae bacterium]